MPSPPRSPPPAPPAAAGAWQLAAANRLDLNVLPDFRWPRFLGQADAFVQQVGGWVGGCGVWGLPRSVFRGGLRRQQFAKCVLPHPIPRVASFMLHSAHFCPKNQICTLQVPGDQDIADLLSALDEGSTAAPGGLYAAALPGGGGAASSNSAAAADPALAGLNAPGAATAAGEQPPAGGKVAAVCAAVRQALEQRGKVRPSLWVHPRSAHELTDTHSLRLDL